MADRKGRRRGDDRTRIAMAVVLASILAAPAGQGEATTMRHHTLTELVAEAERVFVGRCLDVRDGDVAQPGGAIPYTEYTFEVLDTLKGSVASPVTIRQYGARHPRPTGDGRLAVVSRIPAMPVYPRGDEVLLFLVGDSALGLTSPVGLAQGAFRIVTEDGQRSAVNGYNNAGLFRGVTPGAASLRQALVPEETALLGVSRGAVPLAPFLSLVRKLAN